MNVKLFYRTKDVSLNSIFNQNTFPTSDIPSILTSPTQVYHLEYINCVAYTNLEVWFHVQLPYPYFELLYLQGN